MIKMFVQSMAKIKLKCLLESEQVQSNVCVSYLASGIARLGKANRSSPVPSSSDCSSHIGSD